MAELSDGRTVHVSRINIGGDLHDSLGGDLKVVNRWIKNETLKRPGLQPPSILSPTIEVVEDPYKNFKKPFPE